MQYFTLNPLMLSCWFCSDYFCYSSGYHFSEIWSHIFHSRVVASNTLPLPLLVLQSHNCLFSRLCMIFGLTSDVSFSLSCKIVIWSFSQLNRYLVSQSVICLSVSQSINGRRIYRGGVHHPLWTFLISDLVLQKDFFASVIKIISGIYG